MHNLEFGEVYCYASAEDVISIPILLRSGGAAVRLFASLDTGSTYCVFESMVATKLGIEVTTGLRTRFLTANSSFEAFGHEVEINAFGVTTYSIVYFFADPHIKKNVLGRNGWLDRVRLGLVHHENLIYLDTQG
ncbi:MAG: hypothetical protein FJW32_19360 [Acidobacteria bacterium]|nr:hypothetical protein [Acidobacteriota bacterium]